MRKIFTILVVILFANSNTFAQLATYTGAGGGGSTVIGVANETVTPLATCCGFGSNTPCSSGGLSGITVSTAVAAYTSGGPRVYYKITPNVGYQLNVTGVNAGLRKSGTGPSCARFAYSLDNGITWTDDGACHLPNNAGCGTTAVSNWTGGPLPTAITSTTNGIIVAIFPYASSNSSGTFQVNTFNVLGTVTNSGCTTPSAIIGSTIVCAGSSVLLSDASPGGTWSSSNTSIALVNVGSGLLTGVSAGTATVTYSTGATCIATAVATVNPLPAPITGSAQVCIGYTTTLSNSGVGTWNSNNTAVATVGIGTGVVTGITTGTALISFTIATGCRSVVTATVSSVPLPIVGVMKICTGAATTLSDAYPGGTWSSSNTAVASAGAGSGYVMGLSAGTTTITYALSTGCYSLTTLTVDPPPASITGAATVCEGLTTSLSSSTPGGTWSGSNTLIATISGGGILSGIASGTAIITYTAGTTCYTTSSITVLPLPSPITGITIVCSGLSATLSSATPGGTWTSSAPAVASIGAGTGSYTGAAAGTSTITYTAPGGCYTTKSVQVNLLPPAIGGNKNVCIGGQSTLTGGGGTWSSSNTIVATIDPATGVVSGLSLGTSIITYTIGSGCTSVATVTVNPLPPAITGATPICPGTTASLINIAGGTWSSALTTIASADLSTGVVTGVAAGTTTITYTSPVGCIATISILVNPLPSAITGIDNVCAGLTTTLSDATSGGTWSSLHPSIATVGAGSGVVLGLVDGTADIAYTLTTTGCFVTKQVTVNPLPGFITGFRNVCIGLTTTLGNTGGGLWSSSNTLVARVGSSSGLVSGISTGTTTITYTLSTGCIGIAVVTVNPLPLAITGPSRVCEGSSISLTSATAGGTWSSSNAGVAMADITTGVVDGLVSGSATITYTLSTGCITSAPVIVDLVRPIAGIPYVCTSLVTTLANAVTGGTWISSNPSVATVVSGTGKMTAITAGTTTITYTTPVGCTSSSVITVNPFPASISGKPFLCEGATTTLTDSPLGGTWSSANTAIATVDPAGLVFGVMAGITQITYSNGPGCSISQSVSVNVTTSPITGVRNMCNGGDTIYVNDADAPAGIWTSSLVTITTTGMVTAYATGTGVITYTLPTGCLATATLVVSSLPGKIFGPNDACTGSLIALTDTTLGGIWSSYDPTVIIDSATGFVAGLSAGTAVITYVMPTGCSVFDTLDVHISPDVITGPSDVCIGGTSLMANIVTGGTWTSAGTGAGTIDPVTGTVSGIYMGIATITYTTGPACAVTRTISVLPLPAIYGLTGGGTICAGSAGVHLILSGSATGINYDLYNGGSRISTLAGSGSALDYGVFALPGSYTVVADNTATTCTKAMYGTSVINVDPVVESSVSILASDDAVCAGTSVVYTVVPVNGGVLPVYEWRVNGVAVGSGPTYTYKPADKDVIGTIMKSSRSCVYPETGIGLKTASVTEYLVPDVSVSVDPGTTVVKGQNVTFTAAVEHGGLYPSYQWFKNGFVLPGETARTYTDRNLNDYDTVRCLVAGSNFCSLSSSGSVHMRVNTISGIGVNDLVENVIILPNPNKGEFTVKGRIGSQDNEVILELTNMLGQIIYNTTALAKGGNLYEQVKLQNNLASGMYLLNLRSQSGSKVFHVVIEQ